MGKIFGTGTAFFLRQNGSANTLNRCRCEAGSPLDWYRNRQAVTVYKAVGTNTFNLSIRAGAAPRSITTWTGAYSTSRI